MRGCAGALGNEHLAVTLNAGRRGGRRVARQLLTLEVVIGADAWPEVALLGMDDLLRLAERRLRRPHGRTDAEGALHEGS